MLPLINYHSIKLAPANQLLKMNISKRFRDGFSQNIPLFREVPKVGFNYIMNMETNELHYVYTKNFSGSHNLSGDVPKFVEIR